MDVFERETIEDAPGIAELFAADVPAPRLPRIEPPLRRFRVGTCDTCGQDVIFTGSPGPCSMRCGGFVEPLSDELFTIGEAQAFFAGIAQKEAA